MDNQGQKQIDEKNIKVSVVEAWLTRLIMTYELQGLESLGLMKIIQSWQ